MWIYEKKLQYPVKITRPNPKLASAIITQLGGPDGEMGAATRYLQQRYSMPQGQVKAALTDIGTEELAHMEIVSTILYQLTRNLTPAQIKAQGFDTYFVDHTTGVYPQAASGVPYTNAFIQITGDPVADLFEDLAAEQKARLTYDNLLRLIDDPDVADPIRFLRAREVVHFQRFGESLRIVQDDLNSKNFYAFNPAFDKKCAKTTEPCNPALQPTNTCGCAALPETPTPLPAVLVSEKAPCCNRSAVNTCGCATPTPKCGCAVPTPKCGCMNTLTEVPTEVAVLVETMPAAEAAKSCGCQKRRIMKNVCGCG